MNYIKAINAFYDHQEFNPLSSAVINLWHSLMHVNNKSRWKEEFTASMTVLCMKSNLSESSIRKARKELVEKGYITFTSRSGNQAPIYRILPLYEEMDNANDNVNENSGGKSNGNDSGKSNGNDSGKSNTLIKQNETKEKEVVERQEENPHHFYENNIGLLLPFIAEKITQWCEEMSDELVIESMKLAVESNKHFFSYSEGILKQWQQAGIRTLKAAEQAKKEHKKNKKRSLWKQGKNKALFDKLREGGWYEKRRSHRGARDDQ
ncbi:DnaD domain protein [Halobacillus karajensis]|uniref:DnaD domain protein n=1 Tax=Halobacillus karajensis TaxID=195088 RepID=A0A024P5Q4_9BACI|nr:DnaD domain protein [Halobacillus karajensis]CDQ17767.1 DnaD domain protein [Halobacillus karajensis]CDQ24175.1 DnaD domain protein [Halobacillus karajensis]CDQ29578.1 DnaD domain protein [Halobacillus karajensis]